MSCGNFVGYRKIEEDNTVFYVNRTHAGNPEFFDITISKNSVTLSEIKNTTLDVIKEIIILYKL